MSQTSAAQLFSHVVSTLRSHLWLWVVPTVLMTAAAITYALVRPPTWKAAQALLVRDEAAGSVARLGRFDSVDTMKAFQETILEVARNREVVVGALKKLGPPESLPANRQWPGEDDVQRMQRQIFVSAPKGAEFGRTEVIYLSVTGRTRQQAVARTRAVCDELEEHLADLRNAKAVSVIDELQQTLQLAQSDLEQATSRLEEMEREVGADLGDLRSLNDSSGDGNLRAALNQIKVELRQVGTTQEAIQEIQQLLRRAKDDPEELLATPSRLVESQPGLRRLKEGLVDAQLHTASLLGQMSKNHPRVVAAIRAEQEVRQNLHAELSSALRGAEADLRVSELQLRSLERQQAELQSRLDRLATLRARYGNLVDDVRQRTDIVQQAKTDLAEARASQSAASSTSLLTRFHEPETGDDPVGPGRTVIAAAGLGGGLATGIGLVLLLAPIGAGRGRRWSDYLNAGRRATDRLFGRRTSDREPTSVLPANEELGRRADELARAPVVPRRRGEDVAGPSIAPQQPAAGNRPAPKSAGPCRIEDITGMFDHVRKRSGRRKEDRA